MKNKDPFYFEHYKCRCGNIFPAEFGKYGCCETPAKPIFINQVKKRKKKKP